MENEMLESVPEWLLEQYKQDYERWQKEDEQLLKEYETPKEQSNADVYVVDQTSEEFTP